MDPRGKRRASYLVTILGVALLAIVAAMAAEPASPPASPPSTAPVVDQHGPTIKDTYKNHFLIGMAGDIPGGYSDVEMNLVKENFNIVTPENCMKPGPAHPSEDTWRFERPDALVKWCAENKIAVHGHTLVWHAQTNNWFFSGGDKAAVTQRLRDHISTLGGRYKGKTRGWDVVNEAISDGGNTQTAQTENLRNSSWLKTMGPRLRQAGRPGRRAAFSGGSEGPGGCLCTVVCDPDQAQGRRGARDVLGLQRTPHLAFRAKPVAVRHQ